VLEEDLMTMDPDRRRKLRRRLWGLAFLGAIGILIWQTFDRHEIIQSTIVLELGPGSERVERVEVDLWAKGESAGSFHRDRLPSVPMGNPSFKARVPAADVELRIRLQVDGQLIETTRRIVAVSGATITVPLARSLPP
jgi:hypothetical protein